MRNVTSDPFIFTAVPLFGSAQLKVAEERDKVFPHVQSCSANLVLHRVPILLISSQQIDVHDQVHPFVTWLFLER